MSTKTNSLPAVGYLRRSTDKQEASLEEQRAAVERYAREKGYNVLRWYTDDAISGDDTRNRRGFLQMIEDARGRRDFGAILCWDRARFGRFDSIEYGFYVFPLRQAGVVLATVLDGLTDWSDPSMRIIAGVMQEGKHQQLLDHSANVVRGQLSAAREGGWLGKAPYGYRIEGSKKPKRLAIDDPAKVAIVQRMFREYVHDGRSMHDIAGRLNAEGYVSPTGRPNGWRFDSVRVILENPVYVGDHAAYRRSYGKYHHVVDGRVEKGRRRNTGRTPQSEWVVVRDRHEAVIDRGTFEQAQAILARGKTGRAPYTVDDNPYILTGLLRCGRCGSPLHGMERQGRKYYHCGNRRYNGPTACEGVTVREDRVMQEAADYIESGFLALDGPALTERASRGEIRPGDLPKGFAKVKALISPPERPKGERSQAEKRVKELVGQIEKARANLVLLDPENIPAAQDRIRQLATEKERLDEELRQCPPSEGDINAEALAVLGALDYLAFFFRSAADYGANGPSEGGLAKYLEETTGLKDPATCRRYLNPISAITVYTRIEGFGNGIRHTFERGAIQLRTVRDVTGGVQLHPGSLIWSAGVNGCTPPW